MKWKLVPVEPTDEMVDAAWASKGADYVGWAKYIHRASDAYRAMLEAAPPTPSVPDEQLQAAPMTRQVDNAAVDMAALLHDLIEQPTSVPVLTVECETDYWSGGHYHEGTKPHIDPTAVWKLPIGTKLYTAPPAQSVPDEQLQAAFDRGLKAGNEQSVAQQIEIHKLHDSLAAPQPEPLSDERIFKLFLEKAVDKGTAGIYDFARALEREIMRRKAIDVAIAAEKGGAA